MIHSIFLYHSKSGLKLWEKIFTKVDGDADLITAFFYTIRRFISKVLLKSCKTLTMVLDDSFVMYAPAPHVKAYIVIMADKTDEIIIPELISNLKDIIHSYTYIFESWQKKFLVSIFNVLDYPIMELLDSFKVNPSATTRQSKAKA